MNGRHRLPGIPKNERTAVVQCHDVGLDRGEWGKILMKVSVEPA